MPKKAAELSALAVKRLSAPGRYFVGGWGVEGLHLRIKPSGSRGWILRYLVAGKRTDVGLGGYPEVSLEEARDRARELRKATRANGVHPLAQKQEQRAALAAAISNAMSFDEAAAKCIEAKAPSFRNAKHIDQWRNTLKTYASPYIGKRPVDQIETQDVMRVLEPIWKAKPETASRVRGRIEAVLSWCAASGYRSQSVANPARWLGHLDQLLPKTTKLKKVKHHAALPHADAPAFMGKLRNSPHASARALEFLILTAARSGEVLLAKVGEIDFKAKVWRVPAERMKAKKLHTVPLPDAALAMLKPLCKGKAKDALIFPGRINGKTGEAGPMSNMTMTNLLRDMKVPAVPHGFRSTFKDYCREVLGTKYTDEASELALAHVSDDKTRAAYARGELLDERRKLMADWADYLS